MIGYADWIAMPLIAAAAADAAKAVALRYKPRKPDHGDHRRPDSHADHLCRGDHLGDQERLQPDPEQACQEGPRPSRRDHCFQNFPYRALAKAGPPGLVLDEIDLGPVILANSADSVLAAPYHRMSWGMPGCALGLERRRRQRDRRGQGPAR